MERTEFNTRIRRPWKSDDETELSHRLRPLDRLPLSVKNHLIATMSEFAGTFMFLLFAFGGTNAVNTNLPGIPAADPAKLLYISLCFGMSLAVNAWVFFRISGGLFNPAVTMGMMLVGAVDYIRGPLVIFSQFLGGIAAAAVISGLAPGPLNVGTSLGGGTTAVQGLFIEMFLTAQLVFTIFMLAAEKHRGTFIAPVGIGLSLFIAELMGVYYTGGSVNPARSFGPAVVIGSFYNYHWIYWVGPILGSLLASGFYIFIKALEYETVNPQQDDNNEARTEPKSDSQHVENRVRSWDDGTVGVARIGTPYISQPSLEAGRG
ncbi:aquaporin-like protein [Daldinia grandis]|nr:aquaporin-like protein [Daldinia grandis]